MSTAAISAGSPATRSTFLPILVAYIRSVGVDPAGLLERFSLPATVAAMRVVEVPLATARALYEAAERLLADANLGLHVARSRCRGEYGVLEFAARSAPTLRAAYEGVIRYQRLLNDLVEISLEQRGGAAVLEHRIPGEPLCFGRHCNEYGLAMFLILARELSGERVVPQQVWLAHPAPADRSELVAFFGTEDIVFGAGQNGMRFDAAVLDRPVVTADRALLPVMQSYAELLVAQGAPAAAGPAPAALDGAAPGDDLLPAVREQIERSLAEGGPRIQQVAEALELSPRTLQRRLEEADTSFNQIVDEVRGRLSREYLGDRTRTVSQVAFMLGYAEARPFLRAFKRWTGKTPQQFRGELTAPDDADDRS